MLRSRRRTQPSFAKALLAAYVSHICGDVAFRSSRDDLHVSTVIGAVPPRFSSGVLTPPIQPS
eukprot:10160429-Alexandrium_andersonii.AAC.1